MKALFIHGPAASGKTYMANAIAQLCISESNGEEIYVKDASNAIPIHPLDVMDAGVIIVEGFETAERLIKIHTAALKYVANMKCEGVRFIYTSQHDFDLPAEHFIKIPAAYKIYS
jgi:energy-coupling factor transporter ATP-binding protein EcfA2